MTRQPFSAQPRNPAQVLTAAAWNYHRHQVEFPDDRVVVWSWDKERKAPAPQEVSRSEAEAIAGLRLAREALRLDPTNRDAQVAQISLALEKAIERVGYAEFPAKDQATFAAATASGPSILGDVLKTAIADGKTDLAAAAAMALGQVTDRRRTLGHAPASSAGRCALCPGPPRPVRRRQGTGGPGAVASHFPGRAGSSPRWPGS